MKVGTPESQFETDLNRIVGDYAAFAVEFPAESTVIGGSNLHTTMSGVYGNIS